jgi:hypothetical protein
MALVQFSKSFVVAISCPFKQEFVCGSLGPSSTQSCRNRFLLLLPTTTKKLRPVKKFIVRDRFQPAKIGKYTAVFRLSERQTIHNLSVTKALDALKSQTVDELRPRI